MEQNWSGPYAIIEVLQKGTFRLARQDNLSKPLAQKYNMARLKLYHTKEMMLQLIKLMVSRIKMNCIQEMMLQLMVQRIKVNC